MTQIAAQGRDVSDRESSRQSADDQLIVAIDGPAGTGKSSVARELAARLGLDFLDTGAMYRAATALAIDRGIDTSDDRAVASLVREADLRFDFSTDPPTLSAFGTPIMHRLRDADVSVLVSPVSALPSVRKVLVESQRRIGVEHPRLVSEGRDQGSVVFKDAEVKIYLTASPRVRAQRRADQMLEMGQEVPGVDVIEQEIRQRDHADSTRAVGPLTKPDDAVTLDTSDLSREQVIDRLEEIVREQAPDRAQNPE